MANHTATKKSIRKIKVRTERNTAQKSAIKTYLRKVKEAIASRNKDLAVETLKVFQSHMMRGARKHLFHKKKASRLVARLSHHINQL
jgi:small subunit ribosomal protein S20